MPKRVAQVIRNRFRMRDNPRPLWHMQLNMGWNPQRPKRRARERDEETVTPWRLEGWPRMNVNIEETVELSFLLDEAGFMTWSLARPDLGGRYRSYT